MNIRSSELSTLDHLNSIRFGIKTSFEYLNNLVIFCETLLFKWFSIVNDMVE